MTKWQSIETAPKDGTHIVVWARWKWGDSLEEPSDYYACVCIYDEFYGWDKNDSCFVSVTSNPYFDMAVDPTHWMPLPDAPEVEDE